MMTEKPLTIPPRTIMTPGPVEAEPRVLRAMSSAMLGQFDPDFTAIMNEVMVMLRKVLQTENHWAFPVDGTSRAGIEAMLGSVIEEGDKVLVPGFGRFGFLLKEICERVGGDVKMLTCDWGEVFDEEEVCRTIHEWQPKVVAMVHGDTSTGRVHPLKKIGKACRESGGLFIVDAVATVAGMKVSPDEWYIDGLITGTQKCLSIPSGLAPLTYNSRIEAVLQERKSVEEGIAAEGDPRGADRRVRSNYLDLSQLQDYWSPKRLNHHTEATSMIYGLYEGLRVILEEGMPVRLARHKRNEEALVAGIKGMGLDLFGDPKAKLTTVTCVKIPDGVDGDAVRKQLLDDFGIEIASSFGPLHGKIWRIGTMGYSCQKRNVLSVLNALESVLTWQGVQLKPGNGVQSALAVYENHKKSIEKTVAAT